MSKHPFLQRLGIEQPIIQAPMGGGPTTPELVAAVSNAGGLGSLGSAYQTPEQIADAIRRIRALSDRPLNVNLFAGAYQTDMQVDPAPMLSLLTGIHADFGLPPPTLPKLPPDPFPKQLEVVLDMRPAVFSFTFGIPSAEVLERVRGCGITIIGTATTVEEARLLAAAGVDAVVAQGAEAGAHRGTFKGDFAAAMVPTVELVQGIVRAIELPVVASGGLMDGRDIAEALARGAAAAQLGTAFLTCPESGASAAYRQALLAARVDTTVITRAFSGRPARGLANAFCQQLQDQESLLLPYPLQNALTRPMRTEAAKQCKSDFLSLWAGTGVARIRALPAGELVQRLVEELKVKAS